MILEHPSVNNCAVVPINDAETFRAPVAFIMLKKDILIDEEIKNQLKLYVEEKLSDGYRPVKYVFVD